MSKHPAFHTSAHVVDILGNVIGRDQPILRMEKALELVSLLSPEVFADDVVFFDPFCKAGEILLACAFHSCWAKSKGNLQLLDTDKVFKEIYQSHRYFGLAPDERHHRLSMRTFLGNTHSHDAKFNHIIRDGHYLSEIDGTLDKEKFERELTYMIEYIKSLTNKPIVAIGNPPYQENYKGDGSNTGANPIYHLLLDRLIKSKQINEFMMVVPSRWFAGGRGPALREFADELKQSRKIKQIYDFQESKTVFPTVDIKGGVCFLHWDSKYIGKTTFFSHKDGSKEEIDLSQSNIIIRDKPSRSIVEKVLKKADSFISDIAWSWNSFNLSSNYFEKNGEDKTGDVLECITKRGIVKKVSRTKIKKNTEAINKYKVAYPKAVSKGGIPHRPDQIFILDKAQVCTETYMIIDAFETKSAADKLLKYLQTDFVRFLISVKKITQDMTKDTWSLVPYIDLKKEGAEKDIYRYFEISEDEINFIQQKVREWSNLNTANLVIRRAA